MIRLLSITGAILLCCYIASMAFYFRDIRQNEACQGLQIVVLDSLDKHFVNEKDLQALLRQKSLDPNRMLMNEINTDQIESELLQNEMIARIEAYKTPSGQIKLEVEQKMPILRIMSPRGNYYIDNKGSTMPLSSRYVAHVPVVCGYVEKEQARSEERRVGKEC